MLFEQADLDRDGFVSGHEIKDTFLKSGVAQPVLAHIWHVITFKCMWYLEMFIAVLSKCCTFAGVYAIQLNRVN